MATDTRVVTAGGGMVELQDLLDELGVGGSEAPVSHFVGDPGEPAFGDPWLNDGLGYKAGFVKDGDVVHLWGLVRNGDQGSTIFTLPAGFRPGTNDFGSIELPCWDDTANVITRLRITSAGQVIWDGGTGASNGDLINIETHFYAGQ